MFGDVFFFVSSVPLRHALSWWNGSLKDKDDAQEAGSHPDPAINGIPETECRAGTSAYPAIVPHLPHLHAWTQTTLVEEPLPILHSDKGTDKTGTSFEKSNSKVDLPQTSGRTRHQGLQAGSASTASLAPSIVRSGRRSDGSTRNDENNSSLRSSLEGPKPHEPQIYRWQLNDSNTKAVLPREIWHPPPAYEEVTEGVQPDLSESRRSSNSRSLSSKSILTESTSPPAEPSNSVVDEWRLYPPFPSAYPPTPLPAPVKPLPAKSNVVGMNSRRSSDKVQFPGISEEQETSFGQSLQPPRERLDPASDGNLSDDKVSTTGVKNDDSSSDGDSMDVDSEDEEDDFDITLQTPRRRRVANLPFRRSQLNTIASTSSLVSSSESATLSTVAKGTTLRTRSSSESSSSMSLTDTDTSIAPSRKSHKASIFEVGASGVQNSVRTSEKVDASQTSGNGDMPSQSVSKTAYRTKQGNTSANKLVNEDPSGQDKGGKAPAAGSRQAVLPLPPSVPPKEDVAGARAATVRGRGRGRGMAPTRSSSRIANFRPPPASSSPSSSLQIDTNASTVPSARDRTIRNRR